MHRIEVQANARTGRYYSDAETGGNRVVWNSGEIVADSLWGLEPSTGGFRLNNGSPSGDYLYATAAGEVKWNTGAADAGTVWALERSQPPHPGRSPRQ